MTNTAALDQPALRGDQGGPRGTARRGRGLHAGDPGADRSGGLADEASSSPRIGCPSTRAPTFRLHPDMACRRSGRCSRRSAEAWTRASRRGAGQRREHRPATRRPQARSNARGCSRRPTWTRRGRATAGRIRPGPGRLRRKPRSFRPPWCWRPLLRHGSASRHDHGRPHRRGHGPGWHLRPTGRRVRPLQRRLRLGGAAFREDALRQRLAARGVYPLVAARPATRSRSGS